MARALRLITFDATETLLNFRIPVGVKYSECAKKFGIEADSKNVLQNFKKEWKSLSQLHPNFGKDTIGWRNWWTQIVVNSFAPEVPTVEKSLLNKLADDLIEEYKTDSCWVVADGVIDLLCFLKAKNILLGVISNYDSRLETVLQSLCVHSYFDIVVSSYRAGFMKPDKRIFEFTLKELERHSLTPDSCLHIGNSLEFDYYGATNSGWKAFYFGKPSEEVVRVVDSSHLFHNFTDLHNYFSKGF